MALKYALYWIVIAFRELGNMVHVNVSSTFHTIATCDGISYFCSFPIYLYDTYYTVGSVIVRLNILDYNFLLIRN